MFVGVFDHDDRGVDHGPDGDRDPAQAHDVGADVHVAHGDERQQDREGQGQDRDQGAAKVPEEDDADERDDHHLLDELVPKVVDRPLNHVRPVVGRDELDALGQSGLDLLLDRLLDLLDDTVRIDTVADHRYATRHVPFAVQVGDPAPHVGSEVDAGDVLDQDRGAIGLGAEAHALDVGDALDIASTPHHVLASCPLDDPASDVVVALAHRVDDPVEGQVEGEERVGVDLDLVLLDVAAERRDFGHALDAA